MTGDDFMNNGISLDQFADGALHERVNQALKQVLENMMDPNTDFKPKRKVTVEITLQTDENREISNVSVIAKTKLAPRSAVKSVILIDQDVNGEVVASEFRKQIPGQQAIVIDHETGEVTSQSQAKSNLETGLQVLR